MNFDSTPAPRTSESDRDWGVLRLLFVLGCLFSILPTVNAIRQLERNKDYTHWYKFGCYAREGKPLYVDKALNGEIEYTYPPAAAVLLYAPLSYLRSVGFVISLGLLSAASWSFSTWAAAILVTGKWTGRPFLLYAFPGLAVAPYVWDIQFLGQLNLLLLALMLGAFLLVRNRHPVLGSSLFGFAVAVKAFPLPAIAYFVVRRQWMAVFASIISIVAFAWFFPGIVRGFDRNTGELKEWFSIMVGDQSGESMGARSSIGFTRRNQSLISCTHRWLRHIPCEETRKPYVYINVVDVSPKVAQFVGYAACLSLGLLLLLACRFRFAPSLECEGIEIAMVCTLVPLCSPLSWTYFFCWLLPAWTAVGFWMVNPFLKPTVRRNVKIGAIVAGILLASAVSEQFDPTLQACGVTAFGAVTLFLTLAYIRFQLPNRPLEVVQVGSG